jgi:tetratricopeptide (TPR) repeat protein
MTMPDWTLQIDALKQALAEKDRAGANAAVAGLLDAGAPLGSQWRQISELMRVSGELTLAVRAVDAFVAAANGSPEARYSKVVLLTQAGRLQAAHDLAERLPAHVPDPAGRAYLLGNTALTLGRVEEARDYLLTAVKHRPGWGPAWLTLASTGSLKDNPLGDRMLADRAAAEKQPEDHRARYWYAVGKLHADRGEHDDAFAAFAKGAAALRKLTPYSRQGNEKTARAAMSGFPPGFIEDLNARQTIGTARPIFVTGLPRSGTTLVEQILASHSSVADGAELNLLNHLAVATGGASGEAIMSHLASGGSVETMANLYLHLMAERFGAGGRIVDKTIDASRFLGLVACATPDAPLIWMRRDPLDSAWSCFRTFFIHGVAWSYDLTDIAHHFRLEDRLLDFWQDRLGDRLLVVPYGALVDAPETWTSRIVRHAGLSEEAAVFAPHETKRAVATASSLQVRRPINRDGLNVAEPYRKHLQPFVDAYYG